MQQSKKNENDILSAVINFTQSIYSGRRVATDMSSLVDATSRLSLSKLDEWERLIRYEIYRDQEVSLPFRMK